MAENSTPPKERINITYRSKTNGQNPDVELPLKLMVMGNFTGGNDVPFDEREVVSINKHNFNQVMQKMNIGTHVSVKNVLKQDADELSENLKFEGLGDFSPDSIATQVPELNKLLQLREALVALKGPMGNIPDFRKALLEALKDKDTKEKLLLEIKENQSTDENKK